MWKRIVETLFGEQKPSEPDTSAAAKAWMREKNAEIAITLSRILSRDDPEAIADVELAVNDPAKYLQTKGKKSRFKSADDVDPFWASHEVLDQKHYVGFIDFRSDTDELMAALNPLLERRGINDFNWSFIDELVNAKASESLRNDNLLPIVGEKISNRNHVFVHIITGGDSYDFAVLRPDEFAQIEGLRGRGFHIERFYEEP